MSILDFYRFDPHLFSSTQNAQNLVNDVSYVLAVLAYTHLRHLNKPAHPFGLIRVRPRHSRSIFETSGKRQRQGKQMHMQMVHLSADIVRLLLYCLSSIDSADREEAGVIWKSTTARLTIHSSTHGGMWKPSLCVQKVSTCQDEQ